ncbi:hypothetical protein MFLAVUS_009307 [Mucor flavus]|uniref:Fork-head domain-containing protein n=1 Tax=Mucor flavus TaxID=439312 RepID=A0ABP9Z9L6_9FUNG
MPKNNNVKRKITYAESHCFTMVPEVPLLERTILPCKSKAMTSSGLKIKIESVGVHPMEDDDLAMCPSRTRPSWPKKIIPWWEPIEANEKPPHSYSTLIAHAIFSSKDGRLTLSDIYAWIAKAYPSFSVGNGGWQNSIRHNLSLNKKWFYKIDRRPTQKNPGKGCYWTLVAGMEHIFIENLTHETGHSRRHHDIGLTTELSIGQRRGACFYYNRVAAPDMTPSAPASDNNVVRKSLSTPLYTTFRMIDMNEKSARLRQITRRRSSLPTDDSDNDSGIDINISSTKKSTSQKRRRTSSINETCLSSPPTPQLQYASNSMVNSASPNLETNTWVEPLYNDHPWSPAAISVENIWSNVPTVPSQEVKKRQPITINLEEQEIKYFQFDHDEIDFLASPLMPTTFSNDLYYNNLYPPSSNLTYNPNLLSLSSPLLNNQFVSMQDILYF